MRQKSKAERVNQHLHKNLDAVERSRDGFRSGSGDGSGAEERDVLGHASEYGQRMLEELSGRGPELLVLLSLFRHRKAGEFTANATAGGGGTVSEVRGLPEGLVVNGVSEERMRGG